MVNATANDSDMQVENVADQTLEDVGGKPRVLWPAAKETEKYKIFEEKVFQKLDEDDGEEWTTNQKRMSHFTAVIYETAVEEFGTQEPKSLEKKKGGKSRNEKKMETIRKEKSRVLKLRKQASPEERKAFKHCMKS